jgi:hypothetical protein
MYQKEIKEALRRLEFGKKYAPICGGTVSSENLRLAYHIKKLNQDESLETRINDVIETWKEVLVRHNAQIDKVYEYDLKTGLPLIEVKKKKSGVASKSSSDSEA